LDQRRRTQGELQKRVDPSDYLKTRRQFRIWSDLHSFPATARSYTGQGWQIGSLDETPVFRIN